jgi:hypothetical protein
MRNLHVFILAAALTAVGLGIFAYKVIDLGFPLHREARAHVWNVELKLHFNAQDGPTKAAIVLPNDSGHFIVRRQTYVASSYGITLDGDAEGNRLAVFSKRKAQGEQTIYYRASVQAYPGLDQRTPGPEPRIIAPDWDESERAAVHAVLDRVRANAADTETMALNLLDELSHPRPREEVRAVLPANVSQRELADIAANILRTAGIGARTVHGIDLSREGRYSHFKHWIEVYLDGFWQPYAISQGSKALPAGYLPWWRGDRQVAAVDGARAQATTLSVAQAPQDAIESAIERGRAMQEPLISFSLFTLPLESQIVYQTLLLIPIGALVLVVMRQIVGIETFGTFMPVLIALAFRETRLVNGVLMFALVVALGLMVRFYLERLKLLLVPRLSAVLVVVVLMMAALSVLLQKMGAGAGLSLALFPMVILTMTIERMSIVWEEYGPADAMKQGLGSMVVAILAYLAMFAEPVQYLTFTFPELLLVALAVTLLIGRYTGFRLVELWRFRDLAREGP